MQAFNVYLNEKEIDKIFYNDDSRVTVEDVYHSLVDHDGYDYRIVVVKEVK